LDDRLSALLITEPEGALAETLGVAGQALRGGVSGIVVRRPRSTAREVFELTRHLRPATRRLGRLLIVSDRADVALAADADGVHLGDRSLPIPATRRILRPGMLLGRSVHNLDEAGQAEEEGADYLFLSPVFPTRSHPGQPALGVEPLREAVLRAQIPVIALGGVDCGNVQFVAEAGGRGAAAITAFYEVEDPAETARAFRAAFAR
jgi:thiamine-phosphate pyrophosphorylase